MAGNAMSLKQTFLVTGATRGIGAEFVHQLLSNTSNTVIAAVRNIEAPAAQELIKAKQGNLIVVQIDSEEDRDAAIAAKELAAQGIHNIDVIFANAGISTDFKPITQVRVDDLRKVFSVNVAAPLLLFQAFLPLLEASSNPRFIVISSAIGSKGLQRHIPYKSTTYGTSKAAVNFLTLRMAIEHPSIISFVLHPGLVATDIANEGQMSLGKTMQDSLAQGAAVTPQASVAAIIELSELATLHYAGRFYNALTKGEIPW
jgi:norsolorinic acid ketoreductase